MKNLFVLASILTLSNAADIFQTGTGTPPVKIPTGLCMENSTLGFKTSSGTVSYSKKTYDTADRSYCKDIENIPDSTIFAHQSTIASSIFIPGRATQAIIDPLPDILWVTLQKKYPNRQFSRYKSIAELEQKTYNIVLLLSLNLQDFNDFIYQTSLDLRFLKLIKIHFIFINVTENKTPNTELLPRQEAFKFPQKEPKSSSPVTNSNSDDGLMFHLELDF
ncbi:MAG: hypothetical protein KF798_07115 [Candidatus Paracaedibacteraceae bacterium]|nr:hypothetical protein [Candidatus Paracaedibacteraceae bacterium]